MFKSFLKIFLLNFTDNRCYRLCPSSYGYRMRKDQISSGLTLFFGKHIQFSVLINKIAYEFHI